MNEVTRSAFENKRIVLFSGGSAANDVAREIATKNRRCLHFMSPFDSGGSTAALRNAFDMPAIGDLRNRLMAIADDSIPGYAAIARLLEHRLPPSGAAEALRLELEQMSRLDHVLTEEIPHAIALVISEQLQHIVKQLPDSIDLQGASIGNLVIAGSYLNSSCNLDRALALFATIVAAKGEVRAIVNDSAHLFAYLNNGRLVAEQHRLTGKETPPIESPVRSIFLSADSMIAAPIDLYLDDRNAQEIRAAELLCFAPGSFYSSLLATLIPLGVGDAVAASKGKKVFIPNLGKDPEQLGMNFEALVLTLIKALRRDDIAVKVASLIDYIVVDSSRGCYPSAIPAAELAKLGIKLVDVALISDDSAPYYNPQKLVQVLQSLV